MSFVSSKPDPYPTPVDVVVYLISAIMNRVIKRFYCTSHVTVIWETLSRVLDTLSWKQITWISFPNTCRDNCKSGTCYNVLNRFCTLCIIVYECLCVYLFSVKQDINELVFPPLCCNIPTNCSSWNLSCLWDGSISTCLKPFEAVCGYLVGSVVGIIYLSSSELKKKGRQCVLLICNFTKS